MLAGRRGRTGQLVHGADDGRRARAQAPQLREQDAALRRQALHNRQHRVRVSHAAWQRTGDPSAASPTSPYTA